MTAAPGQSASVRSLDRHDCFGSRGCSGLAMPLPRQGQWRLVTACAGSNDLTPLACFWAGRGSVCCAPAWSCALVCRHGAIRIAVQNPFGGLLGAGERMSHV
jgi:hypothetical protein